VLGKHSGRAAFAHVLQQAGIDLEGAELDATFARFKEVADREGAVTIDRLQESFGEVVEADSTAAMIAAAVRSGGKVEARPPARVVARELALEYQDEDYPVVAACFESVKGVFGGEAALAGYEVRRVEHEGEAMAEVTTTIRVNGGSFVGRGVSDDVASGSARAPTIAFQSAGIDPPGDAASGMR